MIPFAKTRINMYKTCIFSYFRELYVDKVKYFNLNI